MKQYTPKAYIVESILDLQLFTRRERKWLLKLHPKSICNLVEFINVQCLPQQLLIQILPRLSNTPFKFWHAYILFHAKFSDYIRSGHNNHLFHICYCKPFGFVYQCVWETTHRTIAGLLTTISIRLYVIQLFCLALQQITWLFHSTLHILPLLSASGFSLHMFSIRVLFQPS